MSSIVISPTIALDPSNHWTTESLVLTQDNLGTECTGSGKLIAKTMDNRLSIPESNTIAGMEIELWGRCPISTIQNDTFTDSDDTLLKNHDGELNCDWQKPIYAAYQAISSAGRSHYTFEKESGSTNVPSEHFTSNDIPSVNDYAVEARIYNASNEGDIVEIYARVTLPYTFYILQYNQTDSTWRIGKWNSGSRTVGQMTTMGSWVQPGGISIGSYAVGRIEVRGSIIKAIINGTERISVEDTDIVSGFAGINIIPGIPENGGTRRDMSITPIVPDGEEDYNPPAPDPETLGLQFDTFKVETLLSDSVTIGFSKNGTTFVGSTKTLLLQPSNTLFTLGNPSDLWSDSWDPSDIHSSEFAILIERSNSDSTPFIDHARAIIYHTGSGSTFTMAGYRETTRQRIQYGWETDYGTAVSAAKRLRSFSIIPQSNPEFKEHRPAGEKLSSEQMVMRESSTAAISGIPCFNELGVILKMLCGAPNTTGTVNERQDHFFRFDNRGEQKGKSITCEYGESPTTIDVFGNSETFNRGTRIKAFTAAELNLELSRSEAGLSGSGFGHRIELDHVMSSGVNDQQTITVTATGGSIRARWNGSEWVTINLPLANAAALDTALETITTIGASGVTVTGTGPYVVEFTGTGKTGIAHPLIEIDPTNATGGTVTITHSRPGGVTEFPIVPIMPEHINVYLADTYATLSSNRMQRCSVMNFSIADRFSPFWAFNRSNGGNFLDRAEGTGISSRFAIKAHADSEVTSLLGTARSNARKFLRIEAIGPIAEGSNHYELVLDAAVKVAAVGSLEDEDGMYMSNYELAATEDRSWGNSLTVWLRNMMTAANYQ